MTEDRRARTLTKLFAPLGLIAGAGEWSGQPVYQYKRGKDLRVVVRKPDALTKHGSLWVPSAQEWEMGYQTYPTDNRWCIAKWVAPGYNREEWERRFGNIMAFPENGTWFLFQPLRYLPDEEWTQWAVDHIAWQTSQNDTDRWNMQMDGMDKRNEAKRKEIEDLTKDNFVNHVPGKRGGDYSAPRTRFDR